MRMTERLMVIDSSRILEDKLDQVKKTARELARFVEEEEPRPLAYEFYFDEDETRLTVFQIHPDSASIELHMEVAAPIFAKFSPLLKLQTIDVFGRPSEKLLLQLRRKSEMLGGNAPVLHHLETGFARFAAQAPGAG
jgi:hypothetical protein